MDFIKLKLKLQDSKDKIKIIIQITKYVQDIKLALCQMIGQSATGQGHEVFNLSEKELVYKQKVIF